MSLLAQAAAPTTDWFVFFAQAGVAGGVLLWFMWRDGKQSERDAVQRERDAKQRELNDVQLKGIENACNRMARANLILVLSLKQADATAKEKAAELIKEIDDVK